MDPAINICVLCGKDDDSPKNVVGSKGLKSMKETCIAKGKEDLHKKLSQLESSESNIVVHINCRKRFTDQRSIEMPVPVKKLRSSIVHVFNWKEDCFLCKKSCNTRYDKNKFREAMTLSLRTKVLERAQERGDEWAKNVLARMESCTDLVAEEADYHSSCMANFRLNENSCRSSVGRPADIEMIEVFEKFCEHFENSMDCEIYSVIELHEKMLKINENGYSLKVFRDKLKSRYKDHVYFVRGEGRHSELVCFRNMTDYIIREMKTNLSTRESVLSAAAKIIKADIRELNISKSQYPNEQDISDVDKGRDWVPESLDRFMSQLVVSKVKRLSINQCIVQAARPRTVIAPNLFGLGVQLEKTFGSKWLVNHLSKLGFSITADEVLRFKQSAIQKVENDLEEQMHIPRDNVFAQWVADNVDHNTATLSGKGTFHGMGIICSSNKPLRGQFGNVPRLKERKKAGMFIENRGVEITQYYKSSDVGLQKLTLSSFEQLLSVSRDPPEMNYDFIWHHGWFYHSESRNRPNWFGFMTCATTNQRQI